MKKFTFETREHKILADIITPVSIYLKVRDLYPGSLLLESSDYHGNKDSYSYICLEPLAEFMVNQGRISERFPDGNLQNNSASGVSVADKFDEFINAFNITSKNGQVNGVFGYTSYDAIEHFESLKLRAESFKEEQIPEMRYNFYRYVIAVNHFQNTLTITENLLEGEKSRIEEIRSLLSNRNYATYSFASKGMETSNITDEEYKQMVSKGKEHCKRGDVFQIVLSRKFSQQYTGDDFNVYRTLRSINPSPYLFYFDYGTYRIFGSSPEAQLEIRSGKAYIHPIAGTFKRTGNDEEDKALAEKLMADKKENAEHVMLVDLARNDLSRNATKVKVDTYREIQFYSHVLHMVSVVSGELPENYNTIKVMADSFPAGTLSGAPKYKAMELIDKYEKNRRGFYGGCIGYAGFDGSFNHAIMIRSFLSKNNTLFYQAGAGIVAASEEENELNEVNNKLMALKTAINLAKEI